MKKVITISSVVIALLLIITGICIGIKKDDVVVASNNMEEVSSIEETMTEETTSIEPTLIEEASTIEESTVVEETTITETIVEESTIEDSTVVEETTEVESTVVEEKPYYITEDGTLVISPQLQEEIRKLKYFENCTEQELVEYFKKDTYLLENTKLLAFMTNDFAEKGMRLHVPTEAELAAQEQAQQQPQQSQPTTTTPAPAEPQPHPQQTAETPAPAQPQPESNLSALEPLYDGNYVPDPAGKQVTSSDQVGHATENDISVPEGIVVY